MTIEPPPELPGPTPSTSSPLLPRQPERIRASRDMRRAAAWHHHAEVARSRDHPARLEDRAAERLLLAWLADPVKPDEVRIGGGVPPVPIGLLVDSVTASTRRLPATAAALLGLPPGVTVGAAALELDRAVNDPDGPRCRSFRAAVYYLRDNHDLLASLDDL